MKRLGLSCHALSICVAAALLAGCGGSQPPVGVPGAVPQTGISGPRNHDHRSIQHVIVIVQENRSFDNLFAGYPNADAPITGLTNTGRRVALRQISLERDEICSNGAPRSFRIAYDRGKMDGWNLLDPGRPLCPYTRVEQAEIQPYWHLAKQFAVGDRMFESTYFGDFVNQLYLIAGTTKIAPRTFVVGYPNNLPWGCDAPPGTRTSLLKNGQFEELGGPFPCFTQFPTMANLLDNAHVSWKYYYGYAHEPFALWNAFDAIKYVRIGRDWKRNMSRPATNILADLAKTGFPSVSWVISPLADSDFPGSSGGPRWVNSIVTATEKSSYWRHSAIIVVWADSADGTFYDDAPPPQITELGLGFRVPLIVISPFAKRDYVSHTIYQFGSVLKFIEENWNLGSLGASDKESRSIGDIFELKQ